MTTSNPDSRRRRAPWRGALTVVAVLAALGAFACTGDDEPEPEPTTAPVARSTP
ncbi:MAG: ABC transporter substrate-binding protein, partial [Chloroflexi bacterium]|nr:ABC transporter substrate-binding protein [Chloroflexota bacterium]